LETTKPIYTPETISPAYQLNWSLTIFWRQSPIPDCDWLTQLRMATEPDGVRVLKHRTCQNNASQFFVSTQPHVSPSRMIRSVKGRLQHLIRQRQPKAFQRNYAVRSIGAATRSVVEDYVGKQLSRHRMADSRVQDLLRRYQREYPAIDLSQPVFSAHGEYWYNLHLVFVNEDRWNEICRDVLDRLVEMIERVAVKYSHRLSRVALLTDHFHMTLGCPVDQSPLEIALRYLNNGAHAVGMKPIFQWSYYAGTVGEYDRGAV
jgi:REP element-mobilizing transposase RayT